MPETPQENLIPKVPREPRMSPIRRFMLAYIKQYIGETGKTPTVRELARQFDKSPSTIHFHLKKLEAMGRIRIPRQHRIELIEGDK